MHWLPGGPGVETIDMGLRTLDCRLPLSTAYLFDLGVAGLHCGCGRNLKRGWLNVDVTHLADREGNSTVSGRLAILDDRVLYLQCDVTQPLPIEDAALRRVYAEHLVEHLSFEAGVRWMAEVRRVMAPGGVFRVTTPDLCRYVAGYTGSDPGFFREHREHLVRIGLPDVPTRPAWMLNQIFQFWGHRWIYDLDELRAAAMAAGFRPDAVVESAFGHSHDPDMSTFDEPKRADETLYVEILT